ncbi:MAG: hypothetical protein KAI80_02575 [Hyphomicrobiaceae bacterium]|nr:hypothetical protein [Hyphomicrobiaceae bacterium]
MSQNLQIQKTINPHATRVRHRRRLLTTGARFRSRHPGLDNFLTREATRANATPLRLVLDSVVAGGTGYAVGDQFSIAGGTSTIPAVGMVTAVSAGVVTAAKIIDGGQYTVVTPPASATTVIRAKNGTTPGTGLTVTDSLTAAVAGVTAAELLAGLRAREDIGGTVPITTRARHYRARRQSSVTYTDNGVPIA